ncbi:MAG TPA: hypothetical protein VIU37_00750 [Candidatus Limnocylindrales bacterium]
MTVDIARMDTNAIAVLGNANDALDRLARWVEAASHAHRLVGGLIDTAFIPDVYKPKVDPRASDEVKAEARKVAVNNATAAVLQGVTLGIDPLMALQQIYIIHGRPGMYAKMMVALIQGHGHEVWTEDLSDTRAVVCGQRKGSSHVERITITMDMARRAKWTSNAKYSETPQDMLWARAAGRVCDRIASDVLKGIATVEQIQDEIQATAEVGTGQRVVAPRKRAAAAAIEATPVEDPPLEDVAAAEPEPVVEEPPPAAPRLITPAQQKKLHALLNETGRKDRDVALVYIAGVLGREIESTKELTVAEAGRVIEAMESLDEPTLEDDNAWPPVAGEGA